MTTGSTSGAVAVAATEQRVAALDHPGEHLPELAVAVIGQGADAAGPAEATGSAHG